MNTECSAAKSHPSPTTQGTGRGLAFAIALTLALPTALAAQDPAAPAPLPPPPPPATAPAAAPTTPPPLRRAPTPPVPATHDDAPDQKEIDVIIRDATRTANEAVRSALKSAHAAAAEAGRSAGKSVDAMLYQFGGGARSSSRSLAILTSGVDPETTDAIEEDLSVMARILQKAARSLRDEERFNAMGINLDSSVFGSASGARNLYIQGHGAVFLLSVKYPLVGPRDAQPANAPTPPPDTEWERTREEVLGAPGGHAEGDDFSSGRSSKVKLEAYDEAKVEGLKTALLDALKNASNIRHLQPAEHVTVVVQGGDGADAGIRFTGSARGGTGTGSGLAATTGLGGTARAEVLVRREVRGGAGGAGGETVTITRAGGVGETVLTLRARKSDIDDFASGKLGADEFRKKATVQAYLRRGDGPPRSARR